MFLPSFGAREHKKMQFVRFGDWTCGPRHPREPSPSVKICPRTPIRR